MNRIAALPLLVLFACSGTRLSVIAEHEDGGVDTTVIGSLTGLDLQGLWAGVAQSMCVTSASFAEEIACFTHGATIRVESRAGGEAASFEYTSRGSLQPPAAMEAAVDQAILLMIERGRDAGVLNW